MKEAVHIATIIKMDSASATLRLLDAGEGCDSCALSMLCGKSETVTVPASEATGLKVGDRVTLKAGSRSRFLAMTLLLGAPLALLIAGLAIGSASGLSDGASALIGAGLCGLWYSALYFLKNTIRRTIKFEISHTNDQ